MRKTTLILVLVAVASFLIFSFAFSQGEKTPVADTVKKEPPKPSTAVAKDTAKADTTKVVHKYIGTFKCKMCHNGELKGKIYDKWASTAHAKAYQALASEQAKTIAKNMGIEDAQKSEKCLKCHVTGYKQATADRYAIEEGVTCEACHGPGEHYQVLKVMQDKKLSIQNGMIMPTEADCIKCHNKDSPTFKEFKFADAFKVIEHRVPKTAPKTEKK